MEWEFIKSKTGNSSARNKIPISKSFIFLSMILLSIVIYYIYLPMFNELGISSKIDPNVIQSLEDGKTTTVYVTGYNLQLDSCIKKWKFGDLIICKTNIRTKNELQTIMKNNNKILSVIFAGYRAVSPVYVKKLSDNDYNKMYDVDIDNEFVNLSGRYCGRGITIGIIDTGVDYLHPDFFENNHTIIKALVSCIYKSNNSCIVYNVSNWNYTQLYNLYLWEKTYKQQYGEYVFIDESGHGTHVAGIVSGRGTASNGKYKGIAPCTNLVIIKTFHSNGAASLDETLDALEWCYYNCSKFGVKILSLSWGAAIPSIENDPITISVNKIAKDKNIIVVVAAGNEGNIPGSITVPAISREAITVGAWDPYKNKLAWFSSIGPTKTLTIKPDIVAPGVMIVSTKSKFADFPDYLKVNDYYVALSGTSMATPVVSGCIANYIEYYKSKFGKEPSRDDFLRYEEINSIKIDFRKDFIVGYGIVQCP